MIQNKRSRKFPSAPPSGAAADGGNISHKLIFDDLGDDEGEEFSFPLSSLVYRSVKKEKAAFVR